LTTFETTRRDVGTSRYRVVAIRGELGLPDVDRLQSVLDKTDADEGVVIGLEQCELVDSIALAALFRAHDNFARNGRRLVIGGPTAHVRRILKISGLDIDGIVFESVERALDDE
jgi:anti-anti-sigma factor